MIACDQHPLDILAMNVVEGRTNPGEAAAVGRPTGYSGSVEPSSGFADAPAGRASEESPGNQSQAKALDDAEPRGAHQTSVAPAEDEGAGRASGGAGAAAPIECPPIPEILRRVA